MAKFHMGQQVRVKYVHHVENQWTVGKEFMIVGITEMLGETLYHLNVPVDPRFLGWLEDQLEAAKPVSDFQTEAMVQQLLDNVLRRKKLPDVIELSTCKELIHVPQR